MSDNNNHLNERFSLSSPSINNIIEAAGFSHLENELNYSNGMEQHTGWTPLIKQSLTNNDNIHNNNNNNFNSNNNGNGMDAYNIRSNSITTQYHQIMSNQFSSPSKNESNGVNIDRLLAIENEFMDNNGNFPLLLSTTPINSRNNGYLLHDLFMDTPNLSSSMNQNQNHMNNNNNNNNNQSFESPTKSIQQSILYSAQKKLTPYRLHQQTPSLMYPDTPGTKFVKSLLELPVTTTPLSRVGKGSPLKDSFSATTNGTPLNKKNKSRKRKMQHYETPKKKLKKALNTPEKAYATGSSPSTIKVASISPASKLKNKANQQFSPTPASQKSSSSSSQMSSQASNFQPPPIGTFKKEEKHIPQPATVIPKNSNNNSGKGPKFQIIFQDVNSLMKKSLAKNKKARSKSGVLTSNNNKKNRLSRSITYAGIDSNKLQQPSANSGSFVDKENQFTTEIIPQAKSSSQSLKQFNPLETNIRDNFIKNINDGLRDGKN